MDAPILKNPIRLLLLFAFVVLAACSDDELNSPIVGDWEGISFTTSIPVDENGDGTAHVNLEEEMDCVAMKAGFTARGNFSITSYEASYNIDIVDGEVILTHTGCSSIDETGNWTLNDASTVLYLEFIVAGKNEPTLVEVSVDLSDRQLIMKNLPFSEDGSVTYTIEFERN